MEKSDIGVYKCVLSGGSGGVVGGVRVEEINAGHILPVLCLLKAFRGSEARKHESEGQGPREAAALLLGVCPPGSSSRGWCGQYTGALHHRVQ